MHKYKHVHMCIHTHTPISTCMPCRSRIASNVWSLASEIDTLSAHYAWHFSSLYDTCSKTTLHPNQTFSISILKASAEKMQHIHIYFKCLLSKHFPQNNKPMWKLYTVFALDRDVSGPREQPCRACNQELGFNCLKHVNVQKFGLGIPSCKSYGNFWSMGVPFLLGLVFVAYVGFDKTQEDPHSITCTFALGRISVLLQPIIYILRCNHYYNKDSQILSIAALVTFPYCHKLWVVVRPSHSQWKILIQYSVGTQCTLVTTGKTYQP